jgi:hypothetical protein
MGDENTAGVVDGPAPVETAKRNRAKSRVAIQKMLDAAAVAALGLPEGTKLWLELPVEGELTTPKAMSALRRIEKARGDVFQVIGVKAVKRAGVKEVVSVLEDVG